MKKDNKRKINLVVLGISCVIFAIIILGSIIDSAAFSGVVWDIVYAIYNRTGWLLNIVTFLCLVFTLYFLFSKHGNIKLGGKDAKPEFKTFTWWSISLCAGMGMGIVFWPAAECIEYAFRPAAGAYLEAGSHEAFVWAEAQTMNHWVITLYAVYVAAGIVAAYVYHNMKQPFSIASTLYPTFGNKVFRYKSVLDGIVTFAIVGGVAGSFGYGVLQVANGLEQVCGIKASILVYIIIAVVITIIFACSSLSGIKKGITWLSNRNAVLFIFMLVFIAVFGPTLYSLNMGVESTGDLFNNFMKYMFFTEPEYSKGTWSVDWNWLWYIDFFIFAPTTAFFLARLAKGRTIKEFIIVNFVAPGAFCMIWTWLFGGLAINAQRTGVLDLNNIILTEGYEAVMLRLFETMPLSTIMKVVMLITICISFITLADSTTSTVAKMSFNHTDEKTGVTEGKEAPFKLQIFWAVLTLVVTLAFILSDGINGCKGVKLLVGFPVFAIETVVIIGFWRMFLKKRHVEATEETQDIETTNDEKL